MLTASASTDRDTGMDTTGNKHGKPSKGPVSWTIERNTSG